MPFNNHIDRTPPTYNREELVAMPQRTVEAVTNQREELKNLSQSLRKEARKNHKEIQTISKRSIVKQRITHLYLSGLYNVRQIARLMCVSEATIRHVLKSPDVQESIVSYQQEEKSVVEQALRSLNLKAVDKISELLDDDNSVVALNAAKDILDRNGIKEVAKKEVNITVSYEERLNSLVNTATIEEVPYIDVINDESAESQINTEGEVISD